MYFLYGTIHNFFQAATPGGLLAYHSASTPGYPHSIGGVPTPMTPRTPADFGVGPPQLQ